MEPSPPEALRYLGIILAERGYPERARAVLSLVLRANPVDEEARNLLQSLSQQLP